MARSRREFLAKGSMGLVGAAVAAKVAGGQVPEGPQVPRTPGAPGAFGTSAATGPEVSVETFVQAEKLVQVEMTPKDLAEAAGNWRQAWRRCTSGGWGRGSWRLGMTWCRLRFGIR